MSRVRKRMNEHLPLRACECGLIVYQLKGKKKGIQRMNEFGK